MTDWNAMSDAEFRKEVRGFFEAEYPEDLRNLPHRPKFAEIEHWHRKLHAKGWVAPAWPAEYGGMGLNASKLLIFYEEQQRWGVNRGRDMGVQMVGPLVIKFGTQEQKDYWLPRILSCEDIWCQGYSEPNAGSDLASLATKAEDKGDHYLVNGQKVWTSYADKADWIFCLVRTDNSGRKHDGISFLLFDMESEGVEARPISLISGKSAFCETFFEDVKVPKDQLVGEVGKGWSIAKYLLTHEREMIGGSGEGLTRPLHEIAAASIGLESGKLSDPMLRAKAAEAEIDEWAFRLTMQRKLAEAKAGASLGADSSMLKYYGTELNKRRHELMMDAAGHDGLEWEGERSSEGKLARDWLRTKANSIEGGTSEVQLNIISKHILQLPGA